MALFGNKNGLTHGHASGGEYSREYRTWDGMHQRCRNPNNPEYPRYGGRGIWVCERWNKFENFLADMGPKPAGLSIDRYPNNNGGYEPDNCRWATPAEQNANMRECSHTIHLTIYGKTFSATKWAAIVGEKSKIICQRRRRGWDDKQCVFGKPV